MLLEIVRAPAVASIVLAGRRRENATLAEIVEASCHSERLTQAVSSHVIGCVFHVDLERHIKRDGASSSSICRFRQCLAYALSRCSQCCLVAGQERLHTVERERVLERPDQTKRQILCRTKSHFPRRFRGWRRLQARCDTLLTSGQDSRVSQAMGFRLLERIPTLAASRSGPSPRRKTWATFEWASRRTAADSGTLGWTEICRLQAESLLEARRRDPISIIC
jgi:hypothetical protein